MLSNVTRAVIIDGITETKSEYVKDATERINWDVVPEAELIQVAALYDELFSLLTKIEFRY